MGRIVNAKDSQGNIIYPRTKEQSIYDANNFRLDRKLAYIANRNILINGDFQVFTKASPLTSEAGASTANMWIDANTGDTVTRVNNTSNAIVQYALQIVKNDGNGIDIYQPVDNYSQYSGRPLTFSCFIRSIGDFVGQFNMSIGNATPKIITLTSSWQRAYITINSASFGSSDGEKGVRLSSTVGNIPVSGNGIEITGIKLEYGMICTSYCPKSYMDEYMDCMYHNDNGTFNNNFLDSLGGSAPMTLTENLEIYMATTGNDITGNGTQGTPYATLEKVLSEIPKNLGGFTVFIHIAPGSYAGASINGYNGGFITLEKDGEGDITFTSELTIYFSNCIRFNSEFIFAPTNPTETAINVTSSSKIYINAPIFIEGCNVGVLCQNNSDVVINNSITINNCTSSLYATLGSSIYVYRINGTNGGTTMSADSGASISYAINTATATTQIHTVNGGRIYTGTQSSGMLIASSVED